MSAASSLQHHLAWELTSQAPVEHVAVAPAGSAAAVADGERNVHVLDGEGTIQGSFRGSYPVGALWASHRGTLFAALAGDVVYAFDAKGQFEWRVELDGEVTDFDLDPSAEHLAAVAGGKLYMYDPQTHERRVVLTGRPMTNVAVVGGEELRIVTCDDEGRLALLDVQGTVQWQKELAARLGGVCAAAVADLIAVPAHERGLLLFRLDGEEVAPVDLGEPVVKAAVAPGGALVMAETAKGRLVLVGTDSVIHWEMALDDAPVAWALGLGGRMVAVAESARTVKAYRLRADPSSETQHGPEPVAKGEREYLEVERIIGGSAGAPRPAAPVHRLLWKKRLPDDLVPAEPSHFRLTLGGEYLVLVLRDGKILVLNRQGDTVVRARTPVPAQMAPRLPSGAFAVWSEHDVVRVDPAEATLSMSPLGPDPVRYFDCSADAYFACTVDGSGRLRAFRGSGPAIWEKALEPMPVGLFVSPQGKMLLVADEEGRYRFYNAEGRLLRKFRFADPHGRRALALGDGFSVFGSDDGHLTVLDAEGRELWSERLFEGLSDIELFGVTLVAYGEGGACAAVDPIERLVWDFRPPPGRARLRKPSGADPVVVHAAGTVISALSGYGRDMKVIWCFECDRDVSTFEVDRQGRTVVALAGGKVYWIEAGISI